MKNTVVILNPAARGQRAKRLSAQVESLVQGAAEIRTTSTRGEAESMARAAVGEGFAKIVAAGGDGTVNEVVNGMAGTNTALGLLPLGTMNVFAAELGLPNDLKRCWEIITAGETRRVDLPSANGKHFVQLAGVGFDAQVVKETSTAFKRSFGPLSYVMSAAQIAGRKPPRLRIESEQAVTEEGSFVLVGNGRLYGGPFPFFKQAVIDDGLLDVLVFKRLNHIEIIRYMQDVIFSPQITSPEVEYFQTTSLRVTSDVSVPVEIDGELIGNCPVEFDIRGQSVRVLVPAEAEDS